MITPKPLLEEMFALFLGDSNPSEAQAALLQAAFMAGAMAVMSAMEAPEDDAMATKALFAIRAELELYDAMVRYEAEGSA